MEKVPKIRFPEFSEVWKHRHLNQIVERVIRKNKGTVSNLPLTISARHGLVDQETFFNKTIASENLEGYYLLKKGEFAYNKSYSNGYPFGAIKRLDRYEKGALSSLYICFKPLENVNSNYLKYYFETGKWHKEVSMIAIEGARNHGLLNIAVLDFFETLHYIPAKDEQDKIAEFLSLIEKELELQEQKLKAVNDYKKGMMQNIFSQELRFKDDEGNEFPKWEKKKLDEITTINPKSPTLPEKFVYIDLECVKSGRLLKKNVISKQEAPSRAQRLAEHQDIFFQMVRAYQKNNFFFEEDADSLPVVVSTGYAQLRTNQDPKFLFYLLHTPSFVSKVLTRSTGTNYPAINSRDLAEIRVFIPILEEQIKIGKLFSELDKQIEKQEKKLALLKQQKRALLQQMFV